MFSFVTNAPIKGRKFFALRTIEPSPRLPVNVLVNVNVPHGPRLWVNEVVFIGYVHVYEHAHVHVKLREPR